MMHKSMLFTLAALVAIATWCAPAAAQTPQIDDDLVLYLPFDSGVGDASGSGQTVSLQGSATITTADKIIGAGSADLPVGQANYIVINHAANLGFTGTNFSMAFWTRIPTGQTFGDFAMVLASNAGVELPLDNLPIGEGWLMGVSDDSSFAGGLLDDSSRGGLVQGNLISDDNWHHVAMTVDFGGLLTVYVDGDEAGTFPLAGVVTGSVDSGSDLYVGRIGAPNIIIDPLIDGFNGTINFQCDDFVIWRNRVLSSLEVAGLHFAGDAGGASLQSVALLVQDDELPPVGFRYTTETLTVTFGNGSSGAVSVDNFSMGGSDAGHFSIDPAALAQLPRTLNLGETFSVDIEWVPTETGASEATFQFTTDDPALPGTQQIAFNSEVLDGPVTFLLDETFDGLAGSLQTATDDEPELRDLGIVGWTHTTPSGWSIDTSAMVPANGVTEWAGWSFTNVLFWSLTNPGQGRGPTGREGVFVIADTDEFADQAGGNDNETFDSTLFSPTVNVDADETVFILWNNDYRQEQAQIGEFAIKEGAGAFVIEKSYSTDFRNNIEIFTRAPQGAPYTMAMSWRLAGNNDWWWSLDNVKVAQTAPFVDTTAAENWLLFQ